MFMLADTLDLGHVWTMPNLGLRRDSLGRASRAALYRESASA